MSKRRESTSTNSRRSSFNDICDIINPHASIASFDSGVDMSSPRKLRQSHYYSDKDLLQLKQAYLSKIYDLEKQVDTYHTRWQQTLVDFHLLQSDMQEECILDDQINEELMLRYQCIIDDLKLENQTLQRKFITDEDQHANYFSEMLSLKLENEKLKQQLAQSLIDNQYLFSIANEPILTHNVDAPAPMNTLPQTVNDTVQHTLDIELQGHQEFLQKLSVQQQQQIVDFHLKMSYMNDLFDQVEWEAMQLNYQAQLDRLKNENRRLIYGQSQLVTLCQKNIENHHVLEWQFNQEYVDHQLEKTRVWDYQQHIDDLSIALNQQQLEFYYVQSYINETKERLLEHKQLALEEEKAALDNEQIVLRLEKLLQENEELKKQNKKCETKLHEFMKRHDSFEERYHQLQLENQSLLNRLPLNEESKQSSNDDFVTKLQQFTVENHLLFSLLQEQLAINEELSIALQQERVDSHLGLSYINDSQQFDWLTAKTNLLLEENKKESASFYFEPSLLDTLDFEQRTLFLSSQFDYQASFNHEINYLVNQNLQIPILRQEIKRLKNQLAKSNIMSQFQHPIEADMERGKQLAREANLAHKSSKIKLLEGETSMESIVLDQQEYLKLQQQDEKIKSLEQQLKDSEARLRARDLYLQNTIMDTAKRVAELEHQLAEQKALNEEMQDELEFLHNERDELEDDLQIINSGTITMQETNDLVLLHDMDTQTFVSLGNKDCTDFDELIEEIAEDPLLAKSVLHLQYLQQVNQRQQTMINELTQKLLEREQEMDNLKSEGWLSGIELEQFQNESKQKDESIKILLRKIEKMENGFRVSMTSNQSFPILGDSIKSPAVHSRDSIAGSIMFAPHPSPSPELSRQLSKVSVHHQEKKPKNDPDKPLKSALRTKRKSLILTIPDEPFRVSHAPTIPDQSLDNRQVVTPWEYSYYHPDYSDDKNW